MGQPEEELLAQGPGNSSCVLTTKANNDNHGLDTARVASIGGSTEAQGSSGPESDSTSRKLTLLSSPSSSSTFPIQDQKGYDKSYAIKEKTTLTKSDFPNNSFSEQSQQHEQPPRENTDDGNRHQEENVIHSHHNPHHPRLGSETHDTVKNNSQESGLSSGGDCVSSCLSSSESFSGSEDISPKSSRKEPLTAEGSTELSDSTFVALRESKDEKGKCSIQIKAILGGDSKNLSENMDQQNCVCNGNCKLACAVVLNEKTTRHMPSDAYQEESPEMTETISGESLERGINEGATCPSEMSSQQQPVPDEIDGNAKEQEQTGDQESSRPSREKKRVFGLSSFGKFNLNKLFSSSTSSTTTTTTSVSTSSQRAAHSSNERLNNELDSDSHRSQGIKSLAIASASLLSNVSKSSSESNILMCHNSLDNLTDDLPSSRSTDSSCLIPTITADDQVLVHHHHPSSHNELEHSNHHHHTSSLEESCQCASCCSCCCCESNGTCDHHLAQHRKRNGIGNGCLPYNAFNRCSSSPATIGRRLQKSGNVNTLENESDEDEDYAVEQYDENTIASLNRDNANIINDGESGEFGEANNNMHHVEDVQTPNNHVITGNNSDSVGDSRALSSRNVSSAGVVVLRNQISCGGAEEGPPASASTPLSASTAKKNANCGDSSTDNSVCAPEASCNNCTGNGNGVNKKPCPIGNKRAMINEENSSTGMSGSSESRSNNGESSESSSCNSRSEGSAYSGNSESCSSSSESSQPTPTNSPPFSSPHGQKFKLLSDGDVQVCRVKHGKSLVTKVIGSKLLRRWETHHLYLNDACISSKTPIGPMVAPIPYWQMEEVLVCVRLDSKRQYVIRIVIPDGSLLLQGSNAYVRDQWYYSILWKKNIYKYQNLMRSSKRPEVILKELKSLVNFATTTPLQDDCISHVPVEIVSNLLDSAGELLGKNQAEEVLVALSPLLERSHPPPSLCRFFSRYCRTRPRCPLVAQLFTPVVRRALKHNVDFGKYPYMRRFIQDYIQALNCHNDGINVVRNFVKSIHGPASSCPHPRVMSNLVSVCLAAMFKLFEKNSNKSLTSTLSMENIHLKEIPYDEQLLCYLAIFDTISEFEDWRPSLAQLLQPIPFPDEALSNPLFTRCLSSVIRRVGTDQRCEVHQMALGIRDGKEGWFHLYAPSNAACFDNGEMWGLMLERLLGCCCRRKRFLSQLGGKLLGSTMLLALRENAAAQEALCLLLEWQLVQSDDQRVLATTTLQSTPTGSANYLALCNRQLHLKELQQKGGPRKLTLPRGSTDKDLAKLLSCGSFGNLECLSLAFTQVTSACAEQLIKLPSLRYLNLWCTQFGDAGLQLISEHLPNLQVLNLCETPLTDKGLLCLTNMTSLRKLNLNSTHLSVQTFESLKKQLPALKEIDVRYTDAW